MEEKKNSIGGITFTGAITVNGPMFDIHDNENVTIHAGGEVKKEDEDGNEDKNDSKEEINQSDLIVKLMPIFYNNEEDVRQFLKEVRGMAQEDITDLVNRWVDDKRISDYGNSRKGLLWGILHEAGLYTRTKENWNGRVK